MKRYALILFIGFAVLGFTSCSKTTDWRVQEMDKIVEERGKDSNRIEFKKNIKFFEDNVSDFTSKSGKYDKYIDESVSFDEAFANDKFEDITFFKDEIEVKDIEVEEVETGKYITTIYRGNYGTGAGIIMLFSKNDTGIERGDLVELTVLPYESFTYKGISLGGEGTIFVVADYEVTK